MGRALSTLSLPKDFVGTSNTLEAFFFMRKAFPPQIILSHLTINTYAINFLIIITGGSL